MINVLAKSLVLVHTVLSVAAMSWAIMLFLDAKDFGWKEPYREVLVYDNEGNPKESVRHASAIDKSQAALLDSKNTRDLTYVYVKPALDQIRTNEAYLANNHLHYRAEMKRLQYAPGELEVKKLQEGGLVLDTPNSNLGKPTQEEMPLANIKKSYQTYGEDFKKLLKEENDVDAEIQSDTLKTKALVAKMTGTDETNKYVQPGLYQLIDLEFKAQTQLKIAIDDIKPRWSEAIENARLYQSQRNALEATLGKLKKKSAPPPTQKPEKKIV
jgi:hypothetical protein